MPTNQYSGNFSAPVIVSSIIPGVVLLDSAPSSSSPAWSPGAAQILPIPVQPALMEIWSVMAWSIAFTGYLQPLVAGTARFGRLGKLVGGIMLDTPFALKPNVFGYTFWSSYAVNPIPSGAFEDTMWDGAASPPFPNFGLGISPLVVTEQRAHTFSFPQPLDVYPGQQISMGLWLTPMLTQNISVYIANATYTIYYTSAQSPGPTGPAPQPR